MVLWWWSVRRIFNRKCHNFALRLCSKIHHRIQYYCAMNVWLEATSLEPYTSTIVDEITMSESILRFARRHNMKGHGSDEYFDSNRLTRPEFVKQTKGLTEVEILLHPDFKIRIAAKQFL
jgi:hypothetical protein